MTTDDREKLGKWLKRARKSAGYSNARAFLAAVKAAEGTAPSYSTYAQWESGEVGAREETLAPIRRFHAARQTPVTPVIDPMERIALALERIGDKLDLLRTDMAGQSGAVVGEVRTLAERLTESLVGRRDAS